MSDDLRTNARELAVQIVTELGLTNVNTNLYKSMVTILESVLASVREEATAAAIELAAQTAHNCLSACYLADGNENYLLEGDHQHPVDAIRALAPKSAQDWLAADRAKQRLEEAKWWHRSHICENSKDCPECKRLAELERCSLVESELHEALHGLQKWYPLPWKCPKGEPEAAQLTDAKGELCLMLMWPTHPIEETRDVELAAYKFMAALAAELRAAEGTQSCD